MLLDDVLCGLDNEVASSVMRDCIYGPLCSSSTRVIFATSISHLQNVDRVYILEAGRIMKSGSYTDVTKTMIVKEMEMIRNTTFEDDADRSVEKSN